jgi:DNA-binding CsgD family transcriptional regulator
LSEDVGHVLGRPATDRTVMDALALGFLAGRVAHRPRTRTSHDPTAFVLNADMVVTAAEGESVLRLPWFDDELFVGRQLREITEMPTPVRNACVENYARALTGERRRFTITSYGHTYSVDAVPVRADDGRVDSVLAIATPTHSLTAAAAAYERTATRLERAAEHSEQRAERHRSAGRRDAERAERQAAQKARDGAERARADARRPVELLTHREGDVLATMAEGATNGEIAERLVIAESTVETHVRNILRKLGARNRTEAVAWYLHR